MNLSEWRGTTLSSWSPVSSNVAGYSQHCVLTWSSVCRGEYLHIYPVSLGIHNTESWPDPVCVEASTYTSTLCRWVFTSHNTVTWPDPACVEASTYSVSQKNPLQGFLKIFPKRLGIFNQFFTHLLCYQFYTRLQIFIQISPPLTKLCHTKRDHLVNFYISLEL